MMRHPLLLCIVAAMAIHPTTAHPDLLDTDVTADGHINEDMCPLRICRALQTLSETKYFNRSFVASYAPHLESCCKDRSKRAVEMSTSPLSNVQSLPIDCGHWNKDGLDPTTTNNADGEAKFGEFPWTVAILTGGPSAVGNNKPVLVGGGSLIHPSVVLTAAHKVYRLKDLKARAGEWDSQNTREIYPYQERDVNNVIVHKDFYHPTYFYDVALLILKSPFELTPNVGVVCLPPSKQRADHGTRCLASGWGSDKFGNEGQDRNIMKKVEVPVVEPRACRSALRKTLLGNLFELHRSFMCAGGELGRDTCAHAGGSPLACPTESEPDRYVQNGIVAWGVGCGEEGTPAVYVDVSIIRDWIDDKVVLNGFDPRVYTYY